MFTLYSAVAIASQILTLLTKTGSGLTMLNII